MLFLLGQHDVLVHPDPHHVENLMPGHALVVPEGWRQDSLAHVHEPVGNLYFSQTGLF